MLPQWVELIAIMLPIYIFLFVFRKIKNPVLVTLTQVYLVLIIFASLFVIGLGIYQNYHQPNEWDFLGFWLNGKVALAGENFYDAINYQKINLPYEPELEFRKEIIDVGSWYPPFAMLLFLPLGLFNDVGNAYLVWQTINLLLCGLCIYGVWKLFLEEQGLTGVLLISALLLGLMPTRSTFYFAQTNFLTLLFFLLFWKHRSEKLGGIWLALGVVVKPYMAAIYLYPLITRKYKVLISAIVSLLVIILLSWLAFGTEVFSNYFLSPIPPLPDWIYIEPTNQSLLATILRFTQFQPSEDAKSLYSLLYIASSLILILITGLTIVISKINDQEWIILSILFLALTIYPANQVFYSIFLIVPLTLMLQCSKYTSRRTILFLIILIVYFLSGESSYIFYANFFMWFVSNLFAVTSDFSLPHRGQVSAKSRLRKLDGAYASTTD